MVHPTAYGDVLVEESPCLHVRIKLIGRLLQQNLRLPVEPGCNSFQRWGPASHQNLSFSCSVPWKLKYFLHSCIQVHLCWKHFHDVVPDWLLLMESNISKIVYWSWVFRYLSMQDFLHVCKNSSSPIFIKLCSNEFYGWKENVGWWLWASENRRL